MSVASANADLMWEAISPVWDEVDPLTLAALQSDLADASAERIRSLPDWTLELVGQLASAALLEAFVRAKGGRG